MNREDALGEIHDLKTFSTQYDDPRLQEDESVRFGWQEEVLIANECEYGKHKSWAKTNSVDSEPLRTLGSQSETGTESLRRFCSFVDLPYDGFKHTEHAVQLMRFVSQITPMPERLLLTPFFFM